MKNKIALMLLMMTAIANFSATAYAGSCSGGAKAHDGAETKAEKQ